MECVFQEKSDPPMSGK